MLVFCWIFAMAVIVPAIFEWLLRHSILKAEIPEFEKTRRVVALKSNPSSSDRERLEKAAQWVLEARRKRNMAWAISFMLIYWFLQHIVKSLRARRNRLKAERAKRRAVFEQAENLAGGKVKPGTVLGNKTKWQEDTPTKPSKGSRSDEQSLRVSTIGQEFKEAQKAAKGFSSENGIPFQKMSGNWILSEKLSENPVPSEITSKHTHASGKFYYYTWAGIEYALRWYPDRTEAYRLIPNKPASCSCSTCDTGSYQRDERYTEKFVIDAWRKLKNEGEVMGFIDSMARNCAKFFDCNVCKHRATYRVAALVEGKYAKAYDGVWYEVSPEVGRWLTILGIKEVTIQEEDKRLLLHSKNTELYARVFCATHNGTMKAMRSSTGGKSIFGLEEGPVYAETTSSGGFGAI